jgi:HJR/Mrr/RecB family endonuclease
MTFVTKFDGRKQPFDKSKIIRTCLRMHASFEQAKEIADKIESKAYDGIPTKKILQMIFTYLKKYRPEIEHEIDLKEAIASLKPKPDFEKFVQLLLQEFGYKVIPNQIVAGKCVEHEIDAIAEKDEEKIFVEIKHHLNPHTYTGVDICLETFARLLDLKEGFEAGLNKINFTKALIICNTKFSEHAKKYAEAKGIQLIGWREPEEKGLERMIEEKKLYPITFLKILDKESQEKLVNSGIVLLKQLMEQEPKELSRKTKIPISKIKTFLNSAKKIFKYSV